MEKFVRSSRGALIPISSTRFNPVWEQDGTTLKGWIAVCRDGSKLPLDPFYSEPGRLELALGVAQPLEAAERRRMTGWRASDVMPP